jgi:WD40 repeat protein
VRVAVVAALRPTQIAIKRLDRKLAPKNLRDRGRTCPIEVLRAFVEGVFAGGQNDQKRLNLSVTNPRFRAEVLPIAAALHGKEPQEIDGEDLRQFRRTRRFWRSAAVALGILTIISAGAAWIATQKSHEATRQRGVALKAETRAVKERDAAVLARNAETIARKAEGKARIEEEKQRKAAEEAERVAVEQRDEAIRQRNLAFARQLAIKAEFLQKDKPGLLSQSMLIAAESLRRAPSLEADRTLRYGLQLLPRQIAELSFNLYLDDQGLSATSNDLFAFFTIPLGELQVVRFTEGGFQQLGKWQPDARPTSIAFDPRFGDRLVITAGKVWLWDLKEPAPKEVPGCGGLAAVSGAGERRTIACVTGPVSIVDVATGAVTEHDIRDVTGLAFDTFGEHLAMARADGSLVVAEVAPWKELFRTDREDKNGAYYAATLVAFSTDGELVIKATGEDKSLHVREVATGTEVGMLNHPDLVLAIAFGDDGRYVATAGADGIARVFESRGGKLVAELRHLGAVRDVHFTKGLSDSFSGASLLLATASEDGTARLWDVGSGREIARAAASAPIGHVVPSFFQAHRLATLSYDGTMRLWDLGREVDGEGILATPLAARWLPRQREFGLAYGHLMGRIDPQRKRRSYFGDFRDSKAAVWSADGATLLMGGEERTQVWNAATQKMIANSPNGHAEAWALSPDGKTFAVAEDKAVKVHRVGREAPIAVIPPPESPKAIAVNGSHLAVAGLSSIVVQRFDDPAAKPDTIHLPNVGKMAFSPDGRFLTWANYEFGVFDVRAGRMLRLLDRTGQRVSNKYFAFSPDGRLIAGASYNDFRIWSLPDGKLVLTARYEGSGTTSEMKSHGQIASIAISGDGRLVALGGTDGIASVRRIADGAEIIRVTMPEPDPGKEPAPIEAVALSDRGDYLLAASSRANRVWPIAVETLVAEACLRLRRSLTKAEWSEYLGSESYRATCEATLNAAPR